MDTGRNRFGNYWKYPSVILKGDNSVGEFYSVAVTNNFQQADTGTKMIHLVKNHEAPLSAKEYLVVKATTVTAVWCAFQKVLTKPEIFRNAIVCSWAINVERILFHTSK